MLAAESTYSLIDSHCSEGEGVMRVQLVSPARLPAVAYLCSRPRCMMMKVQLSLKVFFFYADSFALLLGFQV